MQHEHDLVRLLLVKLLATMRQAEGLGVVVQPGVAAKADQMVVILNTEEVPVQEVRHLVAQGLTDILHSLRPICWRLLFGTLDSHKTQWPAQLHSRLLSYDHRLKSLFTNHTPVHNTDHPLSRQKDSKWNQKFEDVLLWDKIEKDCIRTKGMSREELGNPQGYPNPKKGVLAKESLLLKNTRVLWVYCKLNGDYVQGMNEILGVISQVFLKEGTMQHFECDCYSILEKILSAWRPLFALEEEQASRTSRQFLRILQRSDVGLWSHFREQEVDCRLFLLNWLLGLFSQQFPIQQVLLLWDFIFASGQHYLDRALAVAVTILLLGRESLLSRTGPDMLGWLLNLGPQHLRGQEVIGTAARVYRGYLEK